MIVTSSAMPLCDATLPQARVDAFLVLAKGLKGTTGVFGWWIELWDVRFEFLRTSAGSAAKSALL
jgi:hypothetical protein